MKEEHLLQAIGFVDEELLLEAERSAQRRKFKIGKYLLAAAIIAAMAVTAAATTGLFSRPIQSAQVITGETVAPFDMDRDGNIIPGGIGGLKITMDVEIDVDAPSYLEEYYHLQTPEGWTTYGTAQQSGRYWLNTWWQFWESPAGFKVELEQTTAINYQANGHEVDSLIKLTEKDGVTARKAKFAGMEVLMVTVPELPSYDDDDGDMYCDAGETRLYWSDGRYIFRFIYPAGVSDAEAEDLLSTLYSEPITLTVPEDYGTVNMNKLLDMVPALRIADSGNTLGNIQTAMGRVAWRDGKIFIGAPGEILCYDLQSGAMDSYPLSSVYKDPKYLFVTDSYIGYVNDYDVVEILPRDRSKVESLLYEGIYSVDLYADGMQLYVMGDGLRRIDLETGEIILLAEEVLSFTVDDDYVYVLPGNEENCILRAKKGTDGFERIDLSFYPIQILSDGDDLYLCKGGADTSYQIIRYRNGREEPLPANSYFYQILNGKLLWKDENTVKSFDLGTKETAVLQENVFEFSVLDDRYIFFDIYNQDGILLDTASGEKTTVYTRE